MSRLIEKVSQTTLPVSPVRGNVAFPSVQINLELSRPKSVRAYAAADNWDGHILLLTQREVETEAPTQRELYKTGTICKVKQVLKNEDDSLVVKFEGICRARVQEFQAEEDYDRAVVLCKTIRADNVPAATMDRMKSICRSITEIKDIHPTVTDEILSAAKSITVPGLFADFIASAVLMNYRNKQKVLDCFNPITRVERLETVLEDEMELLKLEFSIHTEVKHRLDDHQKEFFLREQMKAIQQELGEDTDEIAEYEEKIRKKPLPKEVEDKLLKELGRLAKTPFGAAESTVLRNYLDACLELPFGKYSSGDPDVSAAAKILDADHDGMRKVKDRILESVAVRQISA